MPPAGLNWIAPSARGWPSRVTAPETGSRGRPSRSRNNRPPPEEQRQRPTHEYAASEDLASSCSPITRGLQIGCSTTSPFRISQPCDEGSCGWVIKQRRCLSRPDFQYRSLRAPAAHSIGFTRADEMLAPLAPHAFQAAAASTRWRPKRLALRATAPSIRHLITHYTTLRPAIYVIFGFFSITFGHVGSAGDRRL